MCGICGLFYFERQREVQRSVLERMNQTIVHRGPDDAGFHVSENIGLAMRRLSIIDLQTGDQPVTNEDRTLWLVYNGEIYNYKELRGALQQRGHTFSSNSDTESIVHLYEEYGPDCVQHLRGMYAFALWDQKRRRLFAARDRLGIKPLYYSCTADSLAFGSEIKALFECPGIGREFNRGVLPEYLAFGYVSGSETFFRGIQSLPPGHTLEADESGEVRVRPYWDLPTGTAEDGCSREDYVQRYRELFESCVASHLMSDVPLGVFLSGGLDSSAIAAVMTKLRGPVETFSVGYAETSVSELPYARAVASHLKSNHREILMGPEDFFSSLPRLIWHEDKPVTWPSSVSLYFVSKMARDYVTVVLTGEGSDETLAGYERYALTLWNARFDPWYRRAFPARFRSAVREFIATTELLGRNSRRKLQHTLIGRDCAAWESLYFDNFLCAFSQRDEERLLTDPVEPGVAYSNSLAFWENSSGDLLSRMLYTDIKTYLVELLMKQDRMSMATSVESRVPFLDHVLVEFAAQIPPRYKLRGRAGKLVLKAAMHDLLPKKIIYRTKMGFPTPWKSWLAGAYFSRVEQILTESRTIARSLFKPEAVRRLIGEHRAGQYDHTDRLWRLINLELWQRVFVDGEGREAKSAVVTQ